MRQAPWTDLACRMYFQGEGPFEIGCRHLVLCPKLADRCIYYEGKNLIHHLGVHFSDIDAATGCVLLNFLVYGEYEDNQTGDQSELETNMDKHTTAVNAWAVGRYFDLPLLSDLAGRVVVQAGGVLHPIHTFEATADAQFAAQHTPGFIDVLMDLAENVLEKVRYHSAQQCIIRCRPPTSVGEICVMLVLMQRARGDGLAHAMKMLLAALPAYLPPDVMREVHDNFHREQRVLMPQIVAEVFGSPKYRVPKVRVVEAVQKLHRGKIARAQTGHTKRAGMRNKEKPTRM